MTNPRIPFEMSTTRRPLARPQGKSLIVQVVVNVEHWPFDRPMPRQMLTPTTGSHPKPDVPNWSWAEYGMRCGAPRLIALFDRLAIPVATTINASVLDNYAPLAEAMRDAGWEFMGHGWIQRSLQQEEDEVDVIQRSVDRISAFLGKPPRGWLGPGLHETEHTLEHLRAAGIDYVSDWVVDDLPCWIETANGPLIAMPYSLEINDTVIFAIEKHSGEEIYKRISDCAETYEREACINPRVMTIALHPYAIGAPHRLPHLARALEFLKARSDTVFMTGAQIADWFVKADQAARGA